MSSPRIRARLRHLVAAIVAAAGCAVPSPEQAGPAVERISAGIAFYEARASNDPVDRTARRQLVGRYGERFALAADFGDIARAEALAREVIVTSLDRSRDWSRLSSVLLMQHRFAEALAAADSARRHDPADRDAIGSYFDAALAIGHYPDAYSALQPLPPHAVSTLARRVGWYLAVGNATAAAGTQRAICTTLEQSAAGAVSRAWCLTEVGRLADEPTEASAAFEAALRIQPGYRGAIEGLASLALAAGRWEHATRLYRSILSAAHPDLYRRLAAAERGLGNHDRAEKLEAEFRRVVAGDAQEALQGPEIIRASLAKGAAGREAALTVALREVERRPTLESWTLLVEVHRALGDESAAQQAEQELHAIRATISQARPGAPAR
ncbi:MAG: tetratricopeptide repeat protein [Gemmatimonadota bacterium]|nr:tetratricopeptide repeat protein [Gemmatimonadota bacterium]